MKETWEFHKPYEYKGGNKKYGITLPVKILDEIKEVVQKSNNRYESMAEFIRLSIKEKLTKEGQHNGDR